LNNQPVKKKHNLYLIGPMGAGKTVTGQVLAKLTGKEFVDIDQRIQANTGMSINKIFEEKKEPYFRDEEKKVLKDIVQQSGLIVATSGGVVLDSKNREEMNRTGYIVYLVASPETLWVRVQDKTDRPLLQVPAPKDTLFSIYSQRHPLYEATVGQDGVKITTEGQKPEEVAEEIIKKLHPFFSQAR